ncbi:hypothetical protein EYF80_032668 [Liparis tanakae]|uniref:Uncharacterized protein n=1 Tax=Liparis tanakae TaxID=230148 RepID=A0A4Z2GWD5_9TELE|nr:hypothetical protein EYF80_032668 [Liparis tanakae]
MEGVLTPDPHLDPVRLQLGALTGPIRTARRGKGCVVKKNRNNKNKEAEQGDDKGSGAENNIFAWVWRTRTRLDNYNQYIFATARSLPGEREEVNNAINVSTCPRVVRAVHSRGSLSASGQKCADGEVKGPPAMLREAIYGPC